MKFIRLTITSFIIYSICFCTPAHAQKGGPIGIFESNNDIGEQVKAGGASFDSKTGEYTVKGAGSNIWGDHDEFHFVWKKMNGNFILNTRTSLVGKGVDPHRKVGWMVRKSLDSKSPHVNAVVHGDGLTSLQYRKPGGVETMEQKSRLTHADIIEIERRGNSYIMRVAKFGEPFVTDSITDFNLGDEVYIGLFVCSHNKDVVETGKFNNVRVTVPAGEKLVAYRDYLGSHVEVLDVTNGKREIIYSSPKSLQAPNWTPDNQALIYNSEGLIFRLPFKTRQPVVINTGEVKNNNNDHVLSFDGKMLGLSSGVQALGGSIVYTVPVGGGIPKQITPRGQSYLHGWSPDGKKLIFTGQRDNEYDIYEVPSDGGPEVKLTTAKGLDDGSEYSPDGRHIYFNSNRTGDMLIYRMNADGSDQQALTDGEFHDWFPHVSPDGKWILFLSFLKDEVKSGDHPFYKHVYLRIMPVSGKEKPKVVAYLYGGQGTINTPSWSPDSKKVAFISNTGDIK